MSRLHIVVALATAAISACHTGPSASSFTPATTGHGVESTLRLRETRVAGEVLELSDSGYVLLSQNMVTFVPYSAVRSASFSGFGSYDWGRPEPEMMEQLRLMSRFPQGIAASTLQLLMADTGQPSVRVVRQ
jgi:hypothetical protein